MPRSSRHKSSKHSTRDAREYSDVEKESGLKEKKVREDGGSGGGGGSSRHLKDVSSGEKRKLDSKSGGLSKETVVLGNAEVDEFGGRVSSSSKKRKEKVVDDRWVGGDDSSAHEMLKSEMKEKETARVSGDVKRSSRRDGSRVSGFDVEEVKKSGSKAESKHHRSERKERGEKERGSERERKGSRSDKSDKLVVDIVSVSENTSSEGNKKQSGSGKERGRKHGVGNTEFGVQDEFKHPEPEKDLGKRVGRKRDGSGDADRRHDAVPDPDDRRRSSREEERNGKHNDDGHKDEINGDRFLEDIDKDIRRQDEKKRDSRSTRDYTDSKSDDKHLKNNKDLHLSHKISKPHGGDYDRELGGDRERYSDHDRERGRDRDRERNRLEVDRDRERADREHDHVQDIEQEDHERVHDRDHELDRNREYGRERYRREPRDRVRVRDHERGRERDFDHGHDYVSHLDERSSRYKDDRGRRRSPDNYDGYHGDKLRRLETEVDKERSLSLKPNVVSSGSSSRHKDSPSSKAYVGAHKYREGIEDETQYGDTLRDSIIHESVEKAPKYQSGEKRAKFDDIRTGEIYEASPNTKVLSAGVKDRSPSSTSFDRSRFSRRNTRRSLEEDDAERRCNDSIDVRDTSVTQDRQVRDLPPKNSLGEDHPPAESPFYHKTGPGNVSSQSPGPSVFRTRSDSPFGGSFGDNNRGPGSRYRRSVDPNVGRGPGNAWNGLPNWSSPLPNGFMPFPPGPPGPLHGGFPPIVSQFPPFYGFRPTLDMNHQGIHYQVADGDRLTGNVRPIGWPNMAEGSFPNFHAWDVANSIHRNDTSMYGPGPGSGPGHLVQRRDVNTDNWQQNGDMNMEVISGLQNDVPTIKAFTDEASSAHGASKHNVESSCLDDQATSFKDASSDLSPMKEIPLTPAKGPSDKTPESFGADDARPVCAYLLELDISRDLVDPELYNQCSLAINGRCEYVEDEADLEILEEKTGLESEITSSTVDVKFLPAAKESIFQMVMSSYKTQISERKISLVSDGDKFYNPAPSQPNVEQSSMEKVDKICNPSPSLPEMEPTPMETGDNIYNPSLSLPEVVEQTLMEKVDIPADCSIKQEEPTLVHPEEIILKREDEKIDLSLKACDETQMPVFDAEKIVEESSLELLTGNADKGDVDVVNTYPGTILSNPDIDIDVDDGKIVGNESVSEKQLDDAVSGSLFLSNDSVKGCEGLIPVSNETESAVLSRIHHAPESTH